MKVKVLIAGLVIAGSTAVGNGQGRVTKYDLAATPLLEVGANIRIKKVMGQVGTFMLGEFKAGWKNTPHHHTHEQINVGVSGAFNIVTPVAPHDVSRLRGLLIPPDVRHGNDVSAATESPWLIEFQPVRRLDFPPEREKVVFPQASSAVEAPAGIDLDFRKESTGWQRVTDGVRVNHKTGHRASVSAWEFSGAAKNAVDVRPQVTGAEQFVYVIEGGVDVAVGGERHSAAAGNLLLIAPGTPPQVRASSGPALFLVLEAAKVQ